MNLSQSVLKSPVRFAVLLALGIGFALPSFSLSQDGGGVSATGPEASARAVPAGHAVGPDGEPRALPPPPDAIEQRMRRGTVSFQFYDAEATPRRFAGETQFFADYHYRVTSRWSVRRRGRQFQLVIYPRFQGISLHVTHSISLPSSTLDEGFWQHPLVLHEFDHVRISSDERWERWLRRQLGEGIKVLEYPLDSGKKPSEAVVQEQVRRETEEVFQQLIELIRIRYRELDRQTEHGMRPVRDGFFDEFASPPAEPGR